MQDDEDELDDDDKPTDVITTDNVPIKGRQAQGFNDYKVKGID